MAVKILHETSTRSTGRTAPGKHRSNETVIVDPDVSTTKSDTSRNGSKALSKCGAICSAVSRAAALIVLVLAATGLALGYVIQTPFYQYLEQVNPANHRH